MPENLIPIKSSQVRLLPSVYLHHNELTRKYVMSLKNENLLQNYLLEARLWQARILVTPRDERGDIQEHFTGEEMHWGWESPTTQLRGHFLGHWLSAAAFLYAGNHDLEVKAKADTIISELARCQEHNGGEWVGSIPESYFYWTAKGRPTWAPQYVVHKLIMGLLDMYMYAENEQALQILDRFSNWFHRWTGQFTRQQMDDILDIETGGMLEAWADLYGITGDKKYMDLINRYDRPRLFDPLLAGEDVLTNRHANTTIPEAHGAARAYEVTGQERWRRIAEAYWDCAVTRRGTFCTGSQSSGEVWTPPNEFSTRLGPKTQEHCVVYNMIRLADYLFRWTGDPVYSDYIERNLINGILAQQNRKTGMVAYFLPLQAGAHKIWGTPTHDFWCCHGSMIQAHSRVNTWIYYADDEGITVSQYIPSELSWEKDGTFVQCHLTSNPQKYSTHRPGNFTFNIEIKCDRPTEFELRIRIPGWLQDVPIVSVNQEEMAETVTPSSFVHLRRIWHNDLIRLEFPVSLTSCSLPDNPNQVAFMEGPVVLAGLTDEDRIIIGDKDHPETIFTPDNEREWQEWRPEYRTKNQTNNIRFVPLNQICDEHYTVHFNIKKPVV